MPCGPPMIETPAAGGVGVGVGVGVRHHKSLLARVAAQINNRSKFGGSGEASESREHREA